MVPREGRSGGRGGGTHTGGLLLDFFFQGCKHSFPHIAVHYAGACLVSCLCL